MSTEDVGTRWDKTVALFMRCQYYELPPPKLGVDCSLGVVVRPHKLFREGDVVILNHWNGGGERQLVFCRTGRGYSVRMYYLQYRKYRGKQAFSATMRLVELPGELVGLLPTDPTVRRHVVENLTREGRRKPGRRG